jgi:hypothetical protein
MKSVPTSNAPTTGLWDECMDGWMDGWDRTSLTLELPVFVFSFNWRILATWPGKREKGMCKRFKGLFFFLFF